MNGRAACRAAVEAAEAGIRIKLIKLTRTHGMTEAEAIEIAEAWKRAARHSKHLHPKRHRAAPYRGRS